MVEQVSWAKVNGTTKHMLLKLHAPEIVADVSLLGFERTRQKYGTKVETLERVLLDFGKPRYEPSDVDMLKYRVKILEERQLDTNKRIDMVVRSYNEPLELAGEKVKEAFISAIRTLRPQISGRTGEKLSVSDVIGEKHD